MNKKAVVYAVVLLIAALAVVSSAIYHGVTEANDGVLVTQSVAPGGTALSMYFMDVHEGRIVVVLDARTGRMWMADLYEAMPVLKVVPYEIPKPTIEAM